MATNSKLSQALKGNRNAAKDYVNKVTDSARSMINDAKPKLTGALRAASAKASEAAATAKKTASETKTKVANKLVENANRENMLSKANGGGYKYSVGGYIATQRKQAALDSTAKSARADMGKAMQAVKSAKGPADMAKTQAKGLAAGAVSSLKSGNFRQAFGQAKSAASAGVDAVKQNSNVNKASRAAQAASDRAFKAEGAAASYKKTSSAKNYAKNYAKQQVESVKRTANNLKKYMPKKVTTRVM